MSDDRREVPPGDEPEGGSEPPSRPDPAAPRTERPAAAVGPRRTPVTQQIGRIVSLAIAVLFGIFAVANAQYVDFNWVFGGTAVEEVGGERVGGGVRLIVLMVGSFLAGLVVATVDAWRRTRRQRRVPPNGS